MESTSFMLQSTVKMTAAIMPTTKTITIKARSERGSKSQQEPVQCHHKRHDDCHGASQAGRVMKQQLKWRQSGTRKTLFRSRQDNETEMTRNNNYFRFSLLFSILLCLNAFCTFFATRPFFYFFFASSN